MVRPPVELLVLQHRRAHERLSALRLDPASQRKKIQITNRPARISQNVGDRFAHDGPSGFG